MSIKVMSKVWELSQANGTDLLVLLALADMANEMGACWPSVGCLGRRCRISDRTVQRSVRHLEALGEVTVERGRGKTSTSGGTRSNLYRVAIRAQKEGKGVNLTPPVNVTPSVNLTGSGAGDGGMASTVTGRGASLVTPETSCRSVSEPSTAPSPKPRRRSPIPEHFAVTDEMRQWCSDNGIRSNPDHETPFFIDHHRSKGSLFSDPASAWRNWMRRADAWRKPAAVARSGKSATSIAAVRNQVFGSGTVDNHDAPMLTAGPS